MDFFINLSKAIAISDPDRNFKELNKRKPTKKIIGFPVNKMKRILWFT